MDFEAIVDRVLPQFFPAHWLDAPGIVCTDFPSRIRIGYVLRENGGYSFILNDDFDMWSVTLDELHDAAIKNLAQLPSASITFGDVPEGAEGWISATDDNFAAARILLPDVQLAFDKRLGPDFLLTLPHRDDCFCWANSQSKSRQEIHFRDALNDFLTEEYNLTPDVLKYSKGSFHIHLEQHLTEPNL